MLKSNGRVVLALVLSGLLLTGVPIEGGVLTGSWVAPTRNTDGSLLTTLALYRVYYGYYTSSSPCPGSVFVVVPSSTPAPQPGDAVSIQITGLNAGATYSLSVTAVDTFGNESACSAFANAVARDDSAATAAGGTSVPPPYLDIYTDRSVYSPGDTMNVLLSLVSPPNVSQNVDVYVAVQLPGGQVLFFPGGGTTPVPFVTSMLVGPALQVFDYPLLTYTFGGEPAGAYTWYALLTRPGADPMNPANWLSLADAPFTKQ